MTNEINRPAHYTAGEIECIDAIKAALTPDEFRGYLKGNILKYVWRERHKGGVQSLGKAEWYLGRLIGQQGWPITPQPDGWHIWYGSEDCPVATDVRVEVRYSDDYEGSGPAGSFAWGRSGDKFFITHWRLAK